MKGKYDRLRTRYLKYLILFVVSVVIFIAANIQSQQCGYQICYARYTLDNGYSFKNFQVCGRKDRLLEKKVNERLNSCFHILSDKWFGTDSIRLADLIIHCQTERYLSVEYVWDYYPAADNGIYWHLCVTVDMQNGVVVYLDDLIDVNEEFAMLVKNGAVLRECENNDFTGMTAAEVTQMTNEWISSKETDYILDCFMQFTREYLYGDFYRKAYGDRISDWETVLYENYFYLEEDALCFRDPRSLAGVWQGSDIFKIMTKDIETYLKVPNWIPAGYVDSREDNKEDADRSWGAFYSWVDISFESIDPPYVNEKMYENLKAAYGEVDFAGTFQKGAPEVYDLYKEKFRDLIRNRLPIVDKKTDEEMYLKEFLSMSYNAAGFVYHIFDVDEDGAPELGIRVNEYKWIFFKYDIELDKCSLWRQFDNKYIECFGGRRFAECDTDGGEYRFYQLGSDGKEVISTFFFVVQGSNDEESLYIVMIPEYKNQRRAAVMTKEMKEQAIYEKSSGNWYFRVTKSQYGELTKAYFEAEQTAQEELQDMACTYEELMGELSASERFNNGVAFHIYNG